MSKLIIKNDVIFYDEEDAPIISLHVWQVNIERNNKYARTNVKGTSVRMHRLILGVTNPSIFVDHINGNTLDNRKCNLRLCSNAQNLHNRGANKNNPTKLKGVTIFEKNYYRARITAFGKAIHLGLYKDPMAAAQAYNEAAIKYHGEFAKLNIIQKETDPIKRLLMGC